MEIFKIGIDTLTNYKTNSLNFNRKYRTFKNKTSKNITYYQHQMRLIKNYTKVEINKINLTFHQLKKHNKKWMKRLMKYMKVIKHFYFKSKK